MNFSTKQRFILGLAVAIVLAIVLWSRTDSRLDHEAPPPTPESAPQDNLQIDDAIIRPGDILTSPGVPLRYYIASNKRRYTFPNDAAYLSWYPINTRVREVNKAILQTYLLAGNVTQRPGVRIVKFISDPKFYVVSSGAVLRAADPSFLQAYYGTDWQQRVDMIEEWYRIDYTIGSEVQRVRDYSPWQEFQRSPTISHDRGVAPTTE